MALDISQPYMRQLLSLATRQHYRSCLLCIKYRMVHSTSRLEIDEWSILKQLVECSIQYFHVQHPRMIMLLCYQRQKLLRVWSALLSLVCVLYM